MTQISGTMATGINVSRFVAALWTALAFGAGVVLAFTIFVTLGATDAASTTSAAPGAQAPITRSDDYGLRQIDASRPAPAVRDDYALRNPDLGIVQASTRDDYSLRQVDAGGPSASQLDDFGIRHASSR